MLYPRLTTDGKLVSEDQMVGYREHLNQKHRILSYCGEIKQETESCTLLMALDSLSKEPIKMIIDSPGGSLDAAFMLYDTMKTISAPIYTLGRICCSAAVILLAAGKKRYLLPHSKVMLHLPSAVIGGDAHELEIQQREMDNYKDNLVSILQECGVKGTKRKILADIDREFWLDPKEAIAYGLADEVIEAKTMKEWLT